MIPQGLLPEGTEWCVAGGWAACPSLGTDQDVWVLVDADGDADTLENTRHELLEHLRSYFATQSWRLSEQEEARVGDPKDYDNTVVQILKVAQINDGGRVIHLLVADAPSPSYLIRTFDVSTHQIAINSDGRIIKGSEWTPVTMPPVKLRDTKTTDARMLKIAARYGHATANEPAGYTEDEIPF